MIHRRALCLALALLTLLWAAALADGGTPSADAIYHLELRLAELGYFSGRSDGVFDQATREAVEAFQQANGLEVTGEADAATLEKANGDDALSRNAFLEAYASGYAQMETLREGDEGSDIKVAQVRLKELGFYSSRADGAFGEDTRRAVERFQLANGLTVTGEIDGAMMMRLMAVTPITWNDYIQEMVCRPGDTGLSVYALQRRLTDMGYFDGECNGAYGEHTESAVQRFQVANDMEMTGVADADTWTRLYDDAAVRLRLTDALQPGDSGSRVKAAEARLKALGYFAGEPDAEYDLITQTAVRLFQLGHGMEPNGVLGAEDEQTLLSDDAMAADSAAVRDAYDILWSGVDADMPGEMVAAADAALGASFAAGEDSLYPGFRFVQYVCAAAGLPVLQPETLTALADTPVTGVDEVQAGDIVAFQWASQDSVSIQLAVGAGEGRVYRTVGNDSWVVFGFMDQMNSTNIYRWSISAGGEE